MSGTMASGKQSRRFADFRSEKKRHWSIKENVPSVRTSFLSLALSNTSIRVSSNDPSNPIVSGAPSFPRLSTSTSTPSVVAPPSSSLSSDNSKYTFASLLSFTCPTPTDPSTPLSTGTSLSPDSSFLVFSSTEASLSPDGSSTAVFLFLSLPLCVRNQ